MRHAALAIFPLLAFASDEKKLPAGHVTGETAAIEATLLIDKAAIAKALGNDLGGSIIVVDLKITPRGEKPLSISRDDFTLKSDNDGQRSQPFAPSQIAGRGTLVVSSASGGGGSYADNQRGPVWGGAPGTGGGPPGRMGGNGGTIGNGGSESSATATVTGGDRKEDNPLLATLKEKILPEKETEDPVTGLLYFHMEGKHKPKHLVLWYNSPSGKLTVQFR